MGSIMEQPALLRAQRRFRWTDGIMVGFTAAAVSTLILLIAGAVSGRGLTIFADAGSTGFPTLLSAVTGLSAAPSYVVSHTLLYLVAGVVGLRLVSLADRVPPLVTGILLIIIILEFGFLVFTTEGQADGRIDQVTWRSLLIAHALGDIVFALGIVRVHPAVRRTLVRGYEW
jgi:hypothetical protein